MMSDKPIYFDISSLVSVANKCVKGLNHFGLLKGCMWIVLIISLC